MIRKIEKTQRTDRLMPKIRSRNVSKSIKKILRRESMIVVEIFMKDCRWKRKRKMLSIKCRTAGQESTRISLNKFSATRLQLVKNFMSGARLLKRKSS